MSATCGTVVSTTAQDHSGITNRTMELAAGGCAKTQAAPKVHHSSGLRHECTPSGRHLRSIPVAQKGQHDDPRSSIDSTVEDPAVIAQSQSEDVERISPHVLEEKAPQAVNSEVTRLQHLVMIVPLQPVEKRSQEVTETLNVLVYDGSRVGAYTLDFYAPPKLTSEIIQLPILESKRFLRDHEAVANTS